MPWYAAVNGKSIKGDSAGNSDAAEEAAGIEDVVRVELSFDGFHEGQGIARSAPSVESLKCGGAVKHDERTAYFFDVGAQRGEYAVQIVRSVFEAEPAEAGGVHQRFPRSV